MVTHPAHKRYGRWASREGLTRFVAANPATLASVDFPAPESCLGGRACEGCYACSGKQGAPLVRQAAWSRYRRYLADPESYAMDVSWAVGRIRARMGIRLGTPEAPLRLLGSGDVGSIDTWWRFTWALDRAGITWYAYSRHLSTGRRTLYSHRAGRSEEDLALALGEGRRVALWRLPGDPVPRGTSIIFPDHRTRLRVPRDRRDCPKVRGRAEALWPCLRCGRCWGGRP